MAYGKKYTMTFKNRIQQDIYRAEIHEKDFAGDPVELTGAEVPFIVHWQEMEILTPIKPCELTLNFITDGSLKIEDFYSDDDERFRVDYYFQSDKDGGGTEKLLHTGFLIQDGASEPLTDRKHVISLKATDNLALLKSVKWNEAAPDGFTGKHQLVYYIWFALRQTGLYSHNSVIEQNLPLRIFSNIFENSTDDRSDIDTAECFNETFLHSGMFQSNDNTWEDCYSILEKILTGLNACLLQADGCWNIIRFGEHWLFTDGEIPGTEYTFTDELTRTAITASPLATIDRVGANAHPIEENQNKSILRPYRHVLDTFNYNQPVFIIQQDLQIPSDAIPYDSSTSAGIRTDKYDLATYFPDWVQRDGDGSYLVIETNVTVDPEQEETRYMVTPDLGSMARGVQFNPITVSKGDVVNLNVQYRTVNDTDDELRFGVRFILVTPDSLVYNLINFPTINSLPEETGLIWDDFLDDEWDQQNGVFDFISDSDANNIDTREWRPYTLDNFIAKKRVIPPVPVDGVLLIQVCGTNAYGAPEHHTTYWKDIRLDIKSFINSSVQIVGQTHTDTGTSTIKAISENDVNIDDSPRSTIAGTLFTDESTSFNYTDSVTGENTGIIDTFFTRTFNWHRSNITEALRLGNIISQERLQLRYTTRLLIEGAFRNLRYDDDKFISLLSLFRIGFYPEKMFLAAGMELNYMNNSFQATLTEIFNDEDITGTAVFVAGTKLLDESITTGVIDFDSITNYGGADAYINVTDLNSKFNYISDLDTTVDIHVTFFVPISGTGTATFTVKKNGSVIATQTLNAAAHFGHISFDLNEAVTATDYFECFVDPGSADVDIQSGSINIEVNGVLSQENFPYQFNYIYKTD